MTTYRDRVDMSQRGRPEPDILPLEVVGLSFEVGGHQLISDVRLRFEAGVKSFIIGPNGAGKSLLLRLCHGLLTPSAGAILWNGDRRAQHRQRQGMVFQHPVLLRRTVIGNVEYALKVHGIRARACRERALEVLGETGLQPLANQPARVLSGGEQRRLALARAWSLEPRVLFLDEPAAHLDPAASAAVEKIILRISESGTKIIVTSHDIGQVRRLADEVIFMHQGRVLEQSPRHRFFSGPISPEANAFIAGRLLW
jgi:tungstate transport system ATP-binding protein